MSKIISASLTLIVPWLITWGIIYYGQEKLAHDCVIALLLEKETTTSQDILGFTTTIQCGYDHYRKRAVGKSPFFGEVEVIIPNR